MSQFTIDPATGQLAFPGTGRKRKRAPAKDDPRLVALLTDRDAWLLDGGQLAWQAEQVKRRAGLVARLRERRKNGYPTEDACETY